MFLKISLTNGINVTGLSFVIILVTIESTYIFLNRRIQF